MSIGAHVREDASGVPSLDVTRKEVLAILQSDQETAMNEELLVKIVRPMLQLMEKLVRETHDDAQTVRIIIELNGSPAPEKEYLSTAEVAALFQMSQQQVRRWCESGKIRAFQSPQGTWKIYASQFEGVGIVGPNVRKQRNPEDSMSDSISNWWKDNAELVDQWREERD